LPREKHDSFLLVDTSGGYFLIHPHIEERPAVRKGDLEALANNTLLRRDFGSTGSPLYEITPEGRRYYAEMKRRAGEATQTVEAEVHRYLNADVFRDAFTAAYDRWRQAEDELWSAETEAQFTSIGHMCREAMHPRVPYGKTPCLRRQLSSGRAGSSLPSSRRARRSRLVRRDP
jgi:hypothetical protein